MKRLFVCLCGGLLLFGFGCSKSTKNQFGTLKLFLTDAPAAFDAVNVAVTRISVHPAGDDDPNKWQVVSGEAQTVDLLTLQNGVEILFASHPLPAGTYTQIRLEVGSGSTVVTNSQTFPLIIPSGTQSGVKLVHPFTIIGGGTTSLLLDFDAEQSVVQTGVTTYVLVPVIKVVTPNTGGGNPA